MDSVCTRDLRVHIGAGTQKSTAQKYFKEKENFGFEEEL